MYFCCSILFAFGMVTLTGIKLVVKSVQSIVN